MNMYPGSLKDGELGFACHPHEKQKFKSALAKSIEYCQALGSPKMHIVAGNKQDAHSDKEMYKTYLENIEYAAVTLEKYGIEAVIEPINSVTMPGYFLDNFDLAASIIEKVDSKNLKLQFDFFHCQMICGNLTDNFKFYLPIIGHIQISQVPHRNEPDADGEINYRYIFNMIRHSGYCGPVGAEYNQKRPLEDGKGGEKGTFSWIQFFNLEKA